MTKNTIIKIGIALILFTVLLSGCNEQNEDIVVNTSFIGTWQLQPDLNNSNSYIERWTFNEDKTIKIIIAYEGTPTTTISNWEDTGEELCLIIPSEPDNQRCGIYEFSNDGRTFTWTSDEGTIKIFNKI